MLGSLNILKIISFLIIGLFPVLSQAYCIYNNTNMDLHVKDVEGIRGLNSIIKANSYDCCKPSAHGCSHGIQLAASPVGNNDNDDNPIYYCFSQPVNLTGRHHVFAITQVGNEKPLECTITQTH